MRFTHEYEIESRETNLFFINVIYLLLFILCLWRKISNLVVFNPNL